MLLSVTWSEKTHKLLEKIDSEEKGEESEEERGGGDGQWGLARDGRGEKTNKGQREEK